MSSEVTRWLPGMSVSAVRGTRPLGWLRACQCHPNWRGCATWWAEPSLRKAADIRLSKSVVWVEEGFVFAGEIFGGAPLQVQVVVGGFGGSAALSGAHDQGL